MAKWKKLLIDIPAALMIIFGGMVVFYNYQPSHTVITTVKHVPVKNTSQQFEIQTGTDGKSAVISSVSPGAVNSAGKIVSIKPDTVSGGSPSVTGTTSSTTTISSNSSSSSQAGSAVSVPTSDSSTSAPSTVETKNTVTFSLKTLDGYMVSPEAVSVKDGDTVFDVLKRVTDSKGIAVDYMGSGAALYIKGIGGWEERDHGPQSGWTYQINGVKGDRSAGAKDIKPGDKIEWIYVEK